jgi:hypothetical protein
MEFSSSSSSSAAMHTYNTFMSEHAKAHIDVTCGVANFFDTMFRPVVLRFIKDKIGRDTPTESDVIIHDIVSSLVCCSDVRSTKIYQIEEPSSSVKRVQKRIGGGLTPLFELSDDVKMSKSDITSDFHANLDRCLEDIESYKKRMTLPTHKKSKDEKELYVFVDRSHTTNIIFDKPANPDRMNIPEATPLEKTMGNGGKIFAIIVLDVRSSNRIVACDNSLCSSIRGSCPFHIIDAHVLPIIGMMPFSGSLSSLYLTNWEDHIEPSSTTMIEEEEEGHVAVTPDGLTRNDIVNHMFPLAGLVDPRTIVFSVLNIISTHPIFLELLSNKKKKSPEGIVDDITTIGHEYMKREREIWCATIFCIRMKMNLENYIGSPLPDKHISRSVPNFGIPPNSINNSNNSTDICEGVNGLGWLRKSITDPFQTNTDLSRDRKRKLTQGDGTRTTRMHPDNDSSHADVCVDELFEDELRKIRIATTIGEHSIKSRYIDCPCHVGFSSSTGVGVGDGSGSDELDELTNVFVHLGIIGDGEKWPSDKQETKEHIIIPDDAAAPPPPITMKNTDAHKVDISVAMSPFILKSEVTGTIDVLEELKTFYYECNDLTNDLYTTRTRLIQTLSVCTLLSLLYNVTDRTLNNEPPAVLVAHLFRIFDHHNRQKNGKKRRRDAGAMMMTDDVEGSSFSSNDDIIMELFFFGVTKYHTTLAYKIFTLLEKMSDTRTEAGNGNGLFNNRLTFPNFMVYAIIPENESKTQIIMNLLSSFTSTIITPPPPLPEEFGNAFAQFASLEEKRLTTARSRIEKLYTGLALFSDGDVYSSFALTSPTSHLVTHLAYFVFIGGRCISDWGHHENRDQEGREEREYQNNDDTDTDPAVLEKIYNSFANPPQEFKTSIKVASALVKYIFFVTEGTFFVNRTVPDLSSLASFRSHALFLNRKMDVYIASNILMNRSLITGLAENEKNSNFLPNVFGFVSKNISSSMWIFDQILEHTAVAAVDESDNDAIGVTRNISIKCCNKYNPRTSETTVPILLMGSPIPIAKHHNSVFWAYTLDTFLENYFTYDLRSQAIVHHLMYSDKCKRDGQVLINNSSNGMGGSDLPDYSPFHPGSETLEFLLKYGRDRHGPKP